MTKTNVKTTSGCGIISILIIVFCVLKALGIAFAEWGWLKTVLMAIVIGFAAEVALLITVFIIVGILTYIVYKLDE